MTNKVSSIAAIPEVREKLVSLQQEIAQQGGIVMDGRDIGTVVLPQAELKIFLVASVEERAERRYKENIAKGIETDLETLKEEIAARDYKDSHRETSPLKQAEDAVYLDTTGLSIQEVVEKLNQKQKNICPRDERSRLDDACSFSLFARFKTVFWENFDKIVISIKGRKHDKENHSHLGPG